MFSRLVAALVLAAGLVGCASVPMGDAKKDSSLKAFTAKPDTAGVYIYRNENFGGAIRMDVEIDGKPIGQTAAKTFLYKEVAPGKHTVTSKSENSDSIEIDAVGGKLYYIWQEVKMGFLYARTRLQLMGEEEGRKGVLETQLAETR